MTATTIDSAARAVLDLARLGPILPCRPRGKDPLTAHGVKDASADSTVILRWLHRWPDANWAIATGAPGPTVIDLDDPRAVPELVAALDKLGGPCAATARGLHYHCEGQERGTVKIEHGEIRGRGSYVLAPPSIHPSGRAYVWLLEPHAPLPPVPAALAARATATVGAGDMAAVERIAPGGGMHEHLTDLAVRLARAGVLHADVIERMLLAEFAAVRTPGGVYRGSARDTRRIAEWAASSRIAERERASLAGSWWTRCPEEAADV